MGFESTPKRGSFQYMVGSPIMRNVYVDTKPVLLAVCYEPEVLMAIERNLKNRYKIS
jgi:hypothetical protein